MVDLLEMCFDLRKGSVTRLNVWYMRFHLWKGRMVDILETHFDFSKGLVRMVDVLEMCFDLCKDSEDGKMHVLTSKKTM